MRKVLLIAAVVVLGSLVSAALSAQNLPVPSRAAAAGAGRRPVNAGSAARSKNGVKAATAENVVALAPLSERERVLQMLDRFTFGPRPGDVDRVLAMGVDKWFEQQLNPGSINDAALDKQLGNYPTLNMTPELALTVFPDRGTIQRVAEGKQPMPADPQLAAMYEVQIAKLHKEEIRRESDASENLMAEQSDAEKAADKQEGQITAARIAGDLFALPKNQRMAALIQMPVEDRIAFTSNVGGDQKSLLMAEFTPREREIFLAMASNVGASYQIGQELSQAKMVRAIMSERQLQEVMTDFWFNHFNIYIGKDSDQWYTTSYERDAIRKNALGKFSDLLLATAESPAMMVYLDNWLSIGPDSPANGVNPANPRSRPGNKGLNENYGREIMELQTVGVNGGYTQSDVTNLSAILTGWTVNQPGRAGGFEYDPKRHEPGTKVWLGHRIGSGPPFVVQGGSAASAEQAVRAAPEMGAMMMAVDMKTAALASVPGNAGMKEGLEALNVLAQSPQTAHFVCWEIAQRFVADDPPPALVDRMASTFLSSDGDIKAVLRTLVASPEFNSKKYFRNKVKTPMEFLASAYRTTLTDPSNPGALVNAIKNMGMPLYYALPPTGYYITADKWMNTSALVDRLNFAYQLTNGKFANQKFDAAKVVALGLMGEQTMPAQVASGASTRTGSASYAEAALAESMPPVETATPVGTEIALKVLESTLIGDEVSSQTNELIHKQIAQAIQQGTAPGDMLNLLTALVMGSPEFQMR